MIDNPHIEQRGGIGSSNTQIVEQNNHYGLSYADTRDLCKDLIQSELATYRAEALQLAEEREDRLRNHIFEKLDKEKIANSTILEEFKNPDLQFTYVNAQKAYIRVGTEELEKMLAELLLNRIRENKRSLLQVALNESLNVIPMLMPDQMNILSVCFVLRYTKNNGIRSLGDLVNYLSDRILPHIKGDLKKESLYQHLEYSRCGQVSINEISLANLLCHSYPGLFCKGIELEEIESLREFYPKLFLKCLNNNRLWQVNAIDDSVLDGLLNDVSDTSHKQKIKNLFKKNMLSEEEIKVKITQNLPEANNLFSIWDETNLKHLTLTSVGIIIGATFSEQTTGSKYDLNIWI